MKAKRPYMYYDDLATVHVEIGYLIFLFLAIVAYDLTKFTIVLCQPAEDSYLVPGVKQVQEVRVHWNHPYGSDEAIEQMHFTMTPVAPASATPPEKASATAGVEADQPAAATPPRSSTAAAGKGSP